MRRNVLAAAALAASLALGACEARNDAGVTASEPADAPAPAAPKPALSGDFDARGTEPFWALSIRHDRITLTRPDKGEIVSGNLGASRAGGATVWEAARLTVALQETPCSDGMSDFNYPLSAEVRVGNETLKGCAAKAGALPQPGGG